MGWKRIKSTKDGSFPNTPEFDFELYGQFLDRIGATHFSRTPLNASVKDFILNGGNDVKSKSGSRSYQPPFLDHVTFFLTEKGEVVLTYQPYHTKAEIEDKVTGWANENGLNCEVSDHDCAWYFPQSENVCLVVMRLTEGDQDSVNPSNETDELESRFDCSFMGKKVMFSQGALFMMRLYDMNVRTVCGMLNDRIDCPKKSKTTVIVKRTQMRVCSNRNGTKYNMILNPVIFNKEDALDLILMEPIE